MITNFLFRIVTDVNVGKAIDILPFTKGDDYPYYCYICHLTILYQHQVSFAKHATWISYVYRIGFLGFLADPWVFHSSRLSCYYFHRDAGGVALLNHFYFTSIWSIHIHIYTLLQNIHTHSHSDSHSHIYNRYRLYTYTKKKKATHRIVYIIP